MWRREGFPAHRTEVAFFQMGDASQNQRSDSSFYDAFFGVAYVVWLASNHLSYLLCSRRVALPREVLMVYESIRS
jgi:hypothetical protein